MNELLHNTALFIAAAMFALFGALSIQPVKGVR
jgi:hypothetical protein